MKRCAFPLLLCAFLLVACQKNEPDKVLPKVRTFSVNGVDFEMVSVEGGVFQMGATAEQAPEAEADESPVRRVSVPSFWMGKTEVTQALWQAVMGESVAQQRDQVDPALPLRGEGKRFPMYYISWDDCQRFIQRLNQLTNSHFTLPTEAEWEYAARGGKYSQAYKFAGANEASKVAWEYDNSQFQTHFVGQLLPNELGLYDMSGNVWEWCEDEYAAYEPSRAKAFAPSASITMPELATAEPLVSPVGSANRLSADSVPERVMRGGSWFHFAYYARCSKRGHAIPSSRFYHTGLRLALPAQGE